MSRIKKHLILSIPIIIFMVILFGSAYIFKLKSDFKTDKIKIEKLEYDLNERLKESEENKKKIEELKKNLEELKKQSEIKKNKTLLNTPSNVINAGCEIYKPILSKYNWNVENAMLVMSKESGCNPNSVSSTNDHGLFQLHNEPIYDPEKNISRAYQKYERARVGKNNWSAWYAVCTPNLVPKYEGINCS